MHEPHPSAASREPDDRGFMSNTVDIWKNRVAAWRESGRTAEQFSEGQPWSPKTLLGWSSRLGPAGSPRAAPAVRIAQLVRSGAAIERERGGSIVVEALDARLRITIELGAERDTVAAVLNAVLRGPR
jgi:hypothetical protein